MVSHYSILSFFLPQWMTDIPAASAVCSSSDREQKAVGARAITEMMRHVSTPAQCKVWATICIRMQTYF